MKRLAVALTEDPAPAPRKARKGAQPVVGKITVLNPLTRRALDTTARMGAGFLVEWDGFTLTIRAAPGDRR